MQRKTLNRGILITKEQDKRLASLAAELGQSKNAVICMLIDSAQIVDIVKREPVAKLSPSGKSGPTQKAQHVDSAITQQ